MRHMGLPYDKFSEIDKHFNPIDNVIANSNIKNNNNEEINFINHTKNYCVGIVDIIHSTEITNEFKDPRKIREFYSTFINTMAIIIKNFGGRIVKNAGDSVLFYFPKTIDVTNETAFRNTLECGLTMTSVNSIINSKLVKDNLPESLKYRISMDYGKVELAVSTNLNNVDLFGSIINTCAKINHQAPINGMVIGSGLYSFINRFFSHFYKKYSFERIKNNNVFEAYIVKSKADILDDHILKILAHIEQADYRDKNYLDYNAINEPIIKKNHSIHLHQELRKNNSFFNILIVDDDKDILFVFKSILKQEGYKVKTIDDASKALKHFSEVDPYYYDLILLDIRMPSLNGIQLYNLIKAMNPDMKFLFITALDAAQELLSIIPEVKPHCLLKKPVSNEELTQRVKSALYEE